MLIVVVVVWFFVLDAGGYLTAPYDFDYMSATLINAVPLAMLGLAELLVIVSGRGGIDLSVGAIVSLAGMVFGFAYGEWGWPLLARRSLAHAAFGGAAAGRSTDSSSPTSASPRSSPPWPRTTPSSRWPS